MKIYDEIIQKTEELLSDFKPRIYPYDPENAADEGRKNELVLMREAAFELGEGTLPSVSYVAITDDQTLIADDYILLFGKDLPELTRDSPFARITILLTDNIDENGDETAYSIIKDLEMKKYDVSPSGYMMRASVFSNREQVRVSKNALKAGLNFERIGNLFITKYKENVHVRAVKVVFVTLSDAPYGELERLASRSTEITKALNHMLEDIDLNCHACEWKPVCDEVEGMKGIHSKIAKH